jgi:hypothetical protein
LYNIKQIKKVGRGRQGVAQGQLLHVERLFAPSGRDYLRRRARIYPLLERKDISENANQQKST